MQWLPSSVPEGFLQNSTTSIETCAGNILHLLLAAMGFEEANQRERKVYPNGTGC